MMDGFKIVPVQMLGDGSILNLEPYRNKYSPYSRVHEVGPAVPGDEVLVDTYYGLAYDRWIRDGGAPYGLTDLIPAEPLDDFATGFLRVPFARIPCFNVRDLASLLAMIDRIRQIDPGLKLLFRGQSDEYTLGRNSETLQLLYGGEVREPSLLPSAERRNINIDAVGPTWCGFLRFVLDTWATEREDEKQFERIHKFGEHYLFHRFALAMAQHYGLPSSGLDVTDSLEVALFFALHEFSPHATDPGRVICSRVTQGGGNPVLYMFGMEMDQDFLRFESELLGELPATRPARQSAYFLYRGWRMARNVAAEGLLASFNIDPAGDYGPLPDVETLFPSPDVFGAAIDGGKRFLAEELPELHRFLKYFAWLQSSTSPV